MDQGGDLTELREISFRKGFVVTPVYEGSSFGITIFKKPDNYYGLDEAIYKALKVSKGSDVMLDEYISGRELTVSVLNDNVLPIVEIVPKGDYYDYKCKYTKGMSEYISPPDIEKKISDAINSTP